MLKLTQSLLEGIKAHGVASFPYEGCGVLIGTVDANDNLVREILPVSNSWENEEEKRVRFLITDADMLRAELAATAKGLDIIGIFHSHPNHPPVASPRDLAWAAWPGYSYLITEVWDGQAQHSRSWQLLPDRSGFFEETIEIIEDGF